VRRLASSSSALPLSRSFGDDHLPRLRFEGSAEDSAAPEITEAPAVGRLRFAPMGRTKGSGERIAPTALPATAGSTKGRRPGSPAKNCETETSERTKRAWLIYWLHLAGLQVRLSSHFAKQRTRHLARMEEAEANPRTCRGQKRSEGRTPTPNIQTYFPAVVRSEKCGRASPVCARDWRR
jgi:hypothetical protein